MMCLGPPESMHQGRSGQGYPCRTGESEWSESFLLATGVFVSVNQFNFSFFVINKVTSK